MTPNRENVTAVMMALQNEKLGEDRLSFDMRYWVNRTERCGTVACIGGTIQCMINRERGQKSDNMISDWYIQNWLGIRNTPELFHAMQSAGECYLDFEHESNTDLIFDAITKDDAIAALRMCLERGDFPVDGWREVLGNRFPEAA